MSDIKTLYEEFKSDLEQKEYISAQHTTITALSNKVKQQEEEIEHLKSLLADSLPALGGPVIEKVILTPEQALLESQIQMIQSRSIYSELSLEDVKKLDLLLKNKHLVSPSTNKTFDGKSRSPVSNEKLLEILKK